ncbi:MAG: nucleoside hydrolase, partial [Acidimicrobiia bacterium]
DLWIDTDTASDDAVALIIALRHPGVRVHGLSIVAGNVPLESGVQNALHVLATLGTRVPVHAGADRPLARPYASAQMVHGADGMGDIGLDLAGRQPTSRDAVRAIVAHFAAHPGTCDLVTLGPLTNVAVALRAEPRLAGWVRRCVIMGGTGVLPGNVTPLAEYNVWADPEAAHIVLGAGMRVELVGWDVSWQDAVVDDALAAELRALGPVGRYAVDIQRIVREFCRTETKIDGFDLPDPVAMCAAIDETVVARDVHARVDVHLGHGEARGQTVVDHLGVTGRPANARVILRADRARFVAMLRDALRETVRCEAAG